MRHECVIFSSFFTTGSFSHTKQIEFTKIIPGSSDTDSSHLKINLPIIALNTEKRIKLSCAQLDPTSMGQAKHYI